MAYEPYDPSTASVEDRVAWALCQIVDDDAPMRWTRYRFAATCIAKNPELMLDLIRLGNGTVKQFEHPNADPYRDWPKGPEKF